MKNLKLKLEHHYSEKEDIEYWIEKGYDEDGNLAKSLNAILKRVQNRKANDFYDL